MLLTTTATTSGLLPSDYGSLVIQPLLDQSVAAQVSTVVRTSRRDYRIPLVTADPTARWVAEGQEITPSDPTLDELIVTPKKVAGLTIVSRELAEDSDPAAAQVVGDGLARDIARRVDQAYFAGLASPAPSGLATLDDVQEVTSATAFSNLDAFAEAISLAETVGAQTTSFVVSPATALELATVKVASSSNQPLLGQDATNAGERRILGVPLTVSAWVADGTAWAISGSRSYFVLRDDPTVETDRSVYFTSDRVAIKVTMRVSFGFVHPESIIRIAAS